MIGETRVRRGSSRTASSTNSPSSSGRRLRSAAAGGSSGRPARARRCEQPATPPYGFLYDEPGDALIASELEMAVVEKVFRMAAEGLETWTIQARLHAAGVPARMGGPVWDIMVIKRLVLNDLYKPRSYEEMAELLGPEALSRLEPGSLYGVQWHNRRKTTTRMVSEPEGNGGQRYRKRRTTQQRPREEWIAPSPSRPPYPRPWWKRPGSA